jgi:diguanylate cyclase (GGDEF)-like protein
MATAGVSAPVSLGHRCWYSAPKVSRENEMFGPHHSDDVQPDAQNVTRGLWPIPSTDSAGDGRPDNAGEIPHDEWELVAWRRHLFMGIASFTVGAVLLFGYLILTPHGPHRGLLMVINGVAVVCWLVVFAPVGIRVLPTKARIPFFFVWSVTTLALIAAAAGLDGGVGSPVMSLLVLPVLFAALIYPLGCVIALTVVAEVFYVLIALTNTGESGSEATMIGLTLALAGGIAIMAAVNRKAQNQHRKRLTDALHTLATRDGLTGCLTYQAFQDALESEAARARRSGRLFSVVMADLDSFKHINDAQGHDVGDATLRAVVQVLLTAARTSDVVGRLGGDEIAVLLPETDIGQAPVVAQRFQSLVRSATFPAEVTVSFGAATWSHRLDSPAEVMRRADQALYSAKRAGRDRLVLWESECGTSRSVPPALRERRPAGDTLTW